MQSVITCRNCIGMQKLQYQREAIARPVEKVKFSIIVTSFQITISGTTSLFFFSNLKLLSCVGHTT